MSNFRLNICHFLNQNFFVSKCSTVWLSEWFFLSSLMYLGRRLIFELNLPKKWMQCSIKLNLNISWDSKTIWNLKVKIFRDDNINWIESRKEYSEFDLRYAPCISKPSSISISQETIRAPWGIISMCRRTTNSSLVS